MRFVPRPRVEANECLMCKPACLCIAAAAQLLFHFLLIIIIIIIIIITIFVLRYVICRRGVESAVATAYLLQHIQPRARVFSIAGGLNAWASFAHARCPSY